MEAVSLVVSWKLPSQPGNSAPTKKWAYAHPNSCHLLNYSLPDASAQAVEKKRSSEGRIPRISRLADSRKALKHSGSSGRLHKFAHGNSLSKMRSNKNGVCSSRLSVFAGKKVGIPLASLLPMPALPLAPSRRASRRSGGPRRRQEVQAQDSRLGSGTEPTPQVSALRQHRFP